MQRITSLTVENIKRVKVVHITPDGKGPIVVGGKNAAGKTSVLDAIMYACAGKRFIPDDVLSHGRQKGRVLLETEEIIVELKVTKAGEKVTVKSREGKTIHSAQGVLNKLFSTISFDPLRFTMMSPAEQADTFKTMAGLDFTAIDLKKSNAYEARKIKNREVIALNAKRTKKIDGAPESLQSVVDLVAERDAASSHNAEIAGAKANVEVYRDQIAEFEKSIKVWETYVKDAKADIVNRQGNIAEEHKAIDQLGGLKDVSKITSKMENVEEINETVRHNSNQAAIEAEWNEATKESRGLTETIEDCQREREEMLTGANIPVEGLAITDGVVTYKDKLFSNCSSAEQLKISFGMCCAMAPDLRVCMIRDGSLLDDDSLAQFYEMAEAADMQLWIERVGEGEECTVIIEDGTVKGSEDSAPQQVSEECATDPEPVAEAV